MYKLLISTLSKDSDVVESEREFVLDESNVEKYDGLMEEISSYLYDLNIEFDADEGDGDIIIDDILIAIADEEVVDELVSGEKENYKIIGEVL